MTQSTEPKPIPNLREPPLIGSLFAFQNDRTGTLLRVNTECGDIGSFHIGPIKMVLLNSAELVEAVLVKESHRLGRGPFYAMLVPLIGEHSLLANEGERHRRHRRLHTPLFQHKRLTTYVTPMVEIADEFQRRLQDGEPVDAEAAMMRLAQRVVEKTLFNREGGEDPQEIFDAVEEGARFFVYMTTKLLRPPLSWPTPRHLRLRKASAVLRRRAQQLMKEWRDQGGVDRGDILSMLMLSRDEDGTGLSDAELTDHVLTLYNAGHETTAVAFMWVLYHLARHPEVEAKLHQEVDTVLNGRKPEFADLARLPYTLQVIKESLRKCPPGIMFGRSPLEDIDVQGYRLKKGQFLLVSPYSLHHNPKYYPDPERFDPERFSPENEKKLSRYAYIPFSMGPMICIGQHFAMMELQSMIAHLAQHVRFSIAPGQDIKPVPMLTLRPSSLKMIAHRRHVSGGQQEVKQSA